MASLLGRGIPVNLEGRNALVTGGSQGIGAAIVSALAGAGAKVSFCHLNDDENAAALVEELQSAGSSVLSVRADVGNAECVADFVSQAEECHGETDILVNNAGMGRVSPIEDMSLEDFDTTIGTNLRGSFLTARAVFAGMKARGYGRVINFSSQMAFMGETGATAYCASKAGVIGFTKALALEGAPYGVVVNAIAPGPIDTAMLARLPDEWRRDKIARLPARRFGTAEEIAQSVLFLASDHASFYVGTTLHPNGGDVLV